MNKQMKNKIVKVIDIQVLGEIAPLAGLTGLLIDLVSSRQNEYQSI